jgi:hypothetical protein
LSTTHEVVSDLSSTASLEEERRELEAVSAALGGSARLLRLITYIGGKYFQGQTDNLHEYEIATEVFGRSKDTFNGGRDAIVRVEASRLRKRLTEYYAGEGKDHPIHISIPPGSYVPVFTRQSLGPVKPVITIVPAQPVQRDWSYLAVIAAFIALLVGGYLFVRSHRPRKVAVANTPPAVEHAPALNGVKYAEVPLRMLAGYTGKSQIDSAGNAWQPDQYFRYGGNWDRSDSAIARTSDPMLFKHWRNGDFYYDIPLRPGVYELHLYFVAVEMSSSDFSTFSVHVNNDNVLSGFDVGSDALGADVADERIFRDVRPASDGYLHLGFTSERAPATLNAIEILPGTPGQQLPIRMVMQPRSFTDNNGKLWHPDDYYVGGHTSTKGAQVSGTSDPDLFAAERYGHFTYAIPVDTRDRYTLILHFAEFYFGSGASGVGGQGSRVFRVICNGNTLLDNFDIYNEAGSLHALTKTFYHLKPSAQGKLNITFEPTVNNATVSGIEVLDESK